MKTHYFQSPAAFLAIAGMIASASSGLGQDSNATTQADSATTTTVQTAPAAVAPADSSAAVVQTTPAQAPAPPLAYGVSQILELSQAKVDDGTIISYVRNSGNSYGLTADQIIYLRQQGVSSAVLNAMMSQPAPGVMGPNANAGIPMPSGPAPQVSYPQAPPQNTGTVGPSVSGIDPTAAAAANYYYYQPYYGPTYYPYPYYPAYGFYPGV